MAGNKCQDDTDNSNDECIDGCHENDNIRLVGELGQQGTDDVDDRAFV